MQPQRKDGTLEAIEPFNAKKLRRHLARSEIKQVNVFRLAEGEEVEIYGKRYRVVQIRSRGRIQLKEIDAL